MSERRLKHFGWGREGEGLTAEEEASVLDRYRRLFAVDRFDERSPPALSEIALRRPRIAPPPALAPHCSSEPYDRVAHTYGKSFSDYARGLAGQYDNAPDVVAYPRNEAEVTAVADWAAGAQAALIPFGAGSSVVGGVAPRGLVETRRLPGSGAGPSPDRLFIGSEGILGVITEAWIRLQDRPRFRAGGAVQFADFFSASRAVRAIAQAGLYPANCRILDPQEAHNTGAGDGRAAILVLAFESGDHPVDAWIARALE